MLFFCRLQSSSEKQRGKVAAALVFSKHAPPKIFWIIDAGEEKMSPSISLIDLTDDALLLVIQKMILDNVGLESLRRCCKFFRAFFSTYHTELRAMRERAVEKAWMDPDPREASNVQVARGNLSEKEETMMRGEEAHSGGVIFLSACARFILINTISIIIILIIIITCSFTGSL